MVFFERKPAAAARRRISSLATERGSVAVALRRDPRARNYTLRVGSAARPPMLTMPAHGSLREARTFLDRHAGWLVSQMGKLPQAEPIADGGTIPLRGVHHRIRHVAGLARHGDGDRRRRRSGHARRRRGRRISAAASSIS